MTPKQQKELKAMVDRHVRGAIAQWNVPPECYGITPESSERQDTPIGFEVIERAGHEQVVFTPTTTPIESSFTDGGMMLYYNEKGSRCIGQTYLFNLVRSAAMIVWKYSDPFKVPDILFRLSVAYATRSLGVQLDAKDYEYIRSVITGALSTDDPIVLGTSWWRVTRRVFDFPRYDQKVVNSFDFYDTLRGKLFPDHTTDPQKYIQTEAVGTRIAFQESVVDKERELLSSLRSTIRYGQASSSRTLHYQLRALMEATWGMPGETEPDGEGKPRISWKLAYFEKIIRELLDAMSDEETQRGIGRFSTESYINRHLYVITHLCLAVAALFKDCGDPIMRQVFNEGTASDWEAPVYEGPVLS